MVYVLITIVSFVISGLIWRIVFFYKTGKGMLFITWNDDDGCWDAKVRLPINIDYSKQRQILLVVKNEDDSRK